MFENYRKKLINIQKNCINRALATLNWTAVEDNEYGCEYLKREVIYDQLTNNEYWHKVAIAGKANAPTIMLSYDPEVFTEGNVMGNACVGLNAAEMCLFYKRMRIYAEEYKHAD